MDRWLLQTQIICNEKSYKIRKKVINELIRGNLNLYKHAFSIFRDQIPLVITIQLPNKIF